MTLSKRARRAVIAALLPAVVLAAGCGAGDGAQKVVISESVCANARFLRMDLGEKHKIVLDNDQHSVGQISMSFRLEQFPMQILGDVPENAVIDGNTATVALTALPGEESSVKVLPTRAGTYTAYCGVIIGGRSSLTQLRILVV